MVTKHRVGDQLGYFRISARLYNETVTQAKSLDSGALKYKVLEGRSKRERHSLQLHRRQRTPTAVYWASHRTRGSVDGASDF